MLNNRKIKIMTKLASYEQRNGRSDIKLGRYYRMDFIRLQVMKSVVAYTLGYLFVAVMLALYNTEYLIENVIGIDYTLFITYAAAIYIVGLLLYLFITVLIQAVRYEKSRKRLAGYYHNLKELESFYENEEKQGR